MNAGAWLAGALLIPCLIVVAGVLVACVWALVVCVRNRGKYLEPRLAPGAVRVHTFGPLDEAELERVAAREPVVELYLPDRRGGDDG